MLKHCRPSVYRQHICKPINIASTQHQKCWVWMVRIHVYIIIHRVTAISSFFWFLNTSMNFRAKQHWKIEVQWIKICHKSFSEKRNNKTFYSFSKQTQSRGKIRLSIISRENLLQTTFLWQVYRVSLISFIVHHFLARLLMRSGF